MKKRMIFLMTIFLITVIVFVLKNKCSTDDENNNKTIRKEYENILIIRNDEDTITIQKDGEEIQLKSYLINESFEGVVADVVVENDIVTEINEKRDEIRGKVLSVSADGIEIEGYGKVATIDSYKVYDKNDKYNLLDQTAINIGDEENIFIVAEKRICAVFKIEKNYVQNQAQNIRVLIKNNGFADVFHESVRITSVEPFFMIYYKKNDEGKLEEVREEHNALEEILIDNENKELDEGRLSFETKSGEGKITVNSITRNGKNPDYRGKIEISRGDSGLIIINELSIEKYLYGVVPSEMPVSYGVEALKVQAVCARSYALNHLTNTRLSKYGAHVDDSTDYQVYRNGDEDENAIEAVDETFGEVMKCDGNIVNAYFFATSCGITTDSTIWGGEALPYICGRVLCKEGKKIDLTSEDEFRKFIDNVDEENFDSYSNWYRWNITFSRAEMSKIINDNLSNVNKDYLIIESGNRKNVGEISNIQVMKRGVGGIVEELVIEGDLGKIKVLKQSNIRNLFNIKGISVNRADGSIVDTMSALPSAFFYIESNDEEISFKGGGYGHGVGMSQTAVKSMTDEGMSYGEVLKFFYAGIEIEGVY